MNAGKFDRRDFAPSSLQRFFSSEAAHEELMAKMKHTACGRSPDGDVVSYFSGRTCQRSRKASVKSLSTK